MIRINLLAVERERVRRKPGFAVGQKLTVACSLILLVAVLAIAWWYWSLRQQGIQLDRDIAAAEQETARLRSVLTQVQQFELRRAQLQQRVALIEQLRKGQSGPVHMLDELSKAVPERLWLTQLAQKGADLTIDGRTTSLTALSDFVGNLETSGYFRRPVEILSTQVEAQQEGDLVRFAIRAGFQIPEEPGR